MRRVESDIYDHKYFSESDGAGYFFKNKLAPKFLEAVYLSGATDYDCVLDLGCGRGDLLHALAPTKARIVGLDYSRDALAITQKGLSAADLNNNISVVNADATNLGFGDKKFDFVFMVDIVEHLYPEQLHSCFSECHRVLKDDGSLIIHTSPNKWYNDYGYPCWEQRINKILNLLFRQNLMTRPIRTEMDRKVHVNEQTLRTLEESLTQARFAPKIWLGKEYVVPVKKETALMNILEVFRQVVCHAFQLSLIPPLSYLFSNNIWAIATKKS